MTGSHIVAPALRSAFAPALRSAFAPWTLASSAVARQPAFLNNVVVTANASPLRFANANVRESLEASFERIRLMEETPIAMELLNRNARRPKKANHGKRPCSHVRRRQKRLSRRTA